MDVHTAPGQVSADDAPHPAPAVRGGLPARFELRCFRKGSPSPVPVQVFAISQPRLAEIRRVLRDPALHAPRWLSPVETRAGAAILSVVIDTDAFACCIAPASP